LITPDGSIYQRFTSDVESVDGRAIVEMRLPVAGTCITEFFLEGQWTVNVYLDGAVAESSLRHEQVERRLAAEPLGHQLADRRHHHLLVALVSR
jgi:hypothetical protein